MARVTLFLLMLLALSTVDAKQHTFTVGVVPQYDTRELHEIWQPILHYLNEKSGHHFVLKGAPNIPAFEEALLAGEFDFAYTNPYLMLLANQKQGYQPLLRDVGRTLYGILVVTKDSLIKSPAELNGKRVAFPAPNALGASLLMQADLLDRFNSRVTPRFVKTHDSVYLNVLLQQTPAGGGVQKTFKHQPQKITDELRILYKTREVAPHPIAAHPRVDVQLQQQVVRWLLAWGETKEGSEAFNKIPINRLGKATMHDYQPLLDMGLERFYQGVEQP